MQQANNFFFSKPELPTAYNIAKMLRARGWQPANSNASADFGDTHLDFDQETADCLEYKHNLADLTVEYKLDCMPFSVNINDHNWPQILSTLSSKTDFASITWILKPALLNNGQHIHIFSTLAELEQHFSSTQRMGGEQVLQSYITSPHLLRDDRKYSIRMFLILTNYAGAFLYPYGYYNVAAHPYRPNQYQDLRPHLTNEHLKADEGNVIQIPTDRFSGFPPIYRDIKSILSALMQALEQKFPQKQASSVRKLAIFGMDFMLDASGRLWLLEANHGPCFPLQSNHPLQAYLYTPFWKSLTNSFILAIADNKPIESISYGIFEKL